MSSVQGQLLEVTVVGCTKLKDTEWISRQDPYVCLEYASSEQRTGTCTDGGKNPTFQEKFVFPLIEGLREIDIAVWNSNTVTFDDFIGKGKVQLQKVLTQGFDDTAWPIQDKRRRHAGEVRLIMHYANAKNPTIGHGSSAPPYAASPYSAPPSSAAPPHYAAPPYSAPPSSAAPPYYAAPPYSAAQPAATHPLASPYPPSTTNYPAPYPAAPPQPSYAPNPAGYPQPAYPNQPAPYPPTYPPYPQQPAYPPPPHNPQYYPPGAYPPHPR